MEQREECIEPSARGAIDPLIPLARPIGSPLSGEISPPVLPADEFLLPFHTRRSALWDVIIFVLLFLPISIMGEFILAGIYDIKTAQVFDDEAAADAARHRTLLFPVIAWRAVLATVIVVGLAQKRDVSLRSFGLTLRGFWLNLAIGLGAYVVIMLATIVFSLLITIFAPSLDEEFRKNAGRIMEAVPKAPPVVLAIMSLIIGFYEELIFRGVLMTRIRKVTSSWFAAVFLTTLVFAGLHLMDQQAAALLAVTALSLIFSLVCIWRRSLMPAIIAHALFDFTMFMFLYLQAGAEWK